MTIVSIILFVILYGWITSVVVNDYHVISSPLNKKTIMVCSGSEMLVLCLCATAILGLAQVYSLHLGMVELLCVIGFVRSPNRALMSMPLFLYLVFLVWEVYGLTYTLNIIYGVRMILKYLAFFLFALFAAKVVRNGELFLKAGIVTRLVGSLGVILIMTPIISRFFSSFFWYATAYLIGLIPLMIFSFALAEFTNEKRKNMIWGCFLAIPCFIAVFRTSILGTCVAIATFFFVKYRAKALPFILVTAFLGVASFFYIPSIKNKMFKNPDKVEFSDLLNNRISEKDIETNYREFMWNDALRRFYNGHKIIGSGTGRTQTFFYDEAMDARRGGQLHNDFLVILCDNGLIGLILFVLSFIAVLSHCILIYKRESSPIIRMCALVAGSSIMGVFVTMYSDNTLSYSMVTLSIPWGFYGMTLGLKESEKMQ